MQEQISIFVAFLGGTFSFLSPCVLPLFPSYLSFITGMSVEELSDSESKTLKPILQNSLLFVFGFSLVFIAMGASAGFLGGALMTYRDVLQLLGGILVIFFGLYIMGVIKWNVLGRYVQINLASRPLGIFGSVLVGAAFAIGWTPCVGSILGSILALAASRERRMPVLHFWRAIPWDSLFRFFFPPSSFNNSPPCSNAFAERSTSPTSALVYCWWRQGFCS
jgi:cytochrome c-type biogenesis protein